MPRQQKRSSRQWALVAAVAGVGLGGKLQADSATWSDSSTTSPVSWNDDNNWGGTPFPNGQGQSANISVDLTADKTINLNVPITVGALTLADTPTASNNFTLAANGGNLTFDNGASAATITVQSGTNTISAPLTLASNLMISATNGTFLTFSATTATIGGTGDITKTGAGTVNLRAVGSFKGNVTVSAGTLAAGVDNIGPEVLSIPSTASVSVASGATMQFFSSMTIASLSGSGTVKVGNSAGGTNARTLTVNNLSSDTADIFSGTLTLGGTNGQITFVKSGPGSMTFNNAALTTLRDLQVQGGSVTFQGTTAMTAQANRNCLVIGNGGTFNIINTGSGTSNSTDRLVLNRSNGAGYFSLTGGTFNYFGSSNAASSESLGVVTNSQIPNAILFGAGADTINAVAGAGQAVLLNFRAGNPTYSGSTTTSDATSVSYVRNVGASVLIKGSNLGGAVTNTANTANVRFVISSSATAGLTFTGAGGAAGTPTYGILKGFTVDSVISNADNFGIGTYDMGANGIAGDADDIGIRRLANSEYATDITDGDTTTLNNVKLTAASTTLVNPTTVNSLFVSTGGSIDGAGTLTVNSGTILSADGTNNGIGLTTPGTLAFGSGEAIFFNATDLAVNSTVTGTGGLTKGGPARLVLGGSNSFSGATIVNGGLLSGAANSNFGSATSNITLNNGGGIEATATFALETGATKRNVTVNASGGRIAVTAANVLTFSGSITGTGLLTKTDTGTLLLTGSLNTTNGLAVEQGSFRLGAANKITDTVPITLSGGTFDTGGFSETAGALTLSDDSIINLRSTGVLRFAASSLRVWDLDALLTIENWTGSYTGGGANQMIFGASATALTSQQLSQIRFVDPAGDSDPSPGTIYGANILPSGEVVAAVPEPGTFSLLMLGALPLLGRRRRR